MILLEAKLILNGESPFRRSIVNNRLGELKKAIRAFFPNYTTERLAAYLAHAQDGKVFYNSCCCFIGGATADHALQVRCFIHGSNHYADAKNLPGADRAEAAFFDLGRPSYKHPIATDSLTAEDQRRRVLIPIIKAELGRRAKQAQAMEIQHEYALVR